MRRFAFTANGICCITQYGADHSGYFFIEGDFKKMKATYVKFLHNLNIPMV